MRAAIQCLEARVPGAKLLCACAVLAGTAPLAAAGTGGEPSAAEEDIPPTLEDLQAQLDDLQGLQSQIDELKAEQERTPRAVSPMKIFGRIHLDSWFFTDSDSDINVFENDDPDQDPSNDIEFRRARFGLSGKLGENMLYKSEIDFGHPDNLAFKDLFFGWEDIPVVDKFLIGNQKRPYGLDALNSSNVNVFIERPFVVDASSPDARRIGLVAYSVSEDQRWNWRYGAYEMTDVAQDGEIRSDTLQPEFAARLAHTPWYENDGRDYLHLAVSAAQAFPDSDPSSGDSASQARFRSRPEARSDSRWIDTGVIPEVDTYTLVGLEAVANFGPTQITAEAIGTHVFRDHGFDDTNFWGAYVYVSHYLTGEYMPWSRKIGTLGRPKPNHELGKNGWGAWQVSARGSIADYTDKDISGGRGESLTLGLNWLFNAHSSLQLNYIFGRISDRDDDVGGQDYDEGNYQILGMRLRFDF